MEASAQLPDQEKADNIEIRMFLSPQNGRKLAQAPEGSPQSLAYSNSVFKYTHCDPIEEAPYQTLSFDASPSTQKQIVSQSSPTIKVQQNHLHSYNEQSVQTVLKSQNASHRQNVKSSRNIQTIKKKLQQLSSKKKPQLSQEKKIEGKQKKLFTIRDDLKSTNEIIKVSPAARRIHPTHTKSIFINSVPINDQQKDSLDSQQKQRPTMVKGSNRINELESALHLEMVHSEELRIKNAILTELLSKKLDSITKLSTSNNQKPIDLFLQLKLAQRKIIQMQANNQKINKQRAQLKMQIEKQRRKEWDRKQIQQKICQKKDFKTESKLPLKKIYSPQKNILKELNELKQTNQILLIHVQQQRIQKQRYHQQIIYFEQEIERLNKKHQQYTQIERPKFVTDLNQKIKLLKLADSQIQRLKMETNLIAISATHENNALIERISILEDIVLKKDQQIIHFNRTNFKQKYSLFTQTEEILENDALKQQLQLMKQQRDFYLRENKKKVQQISQIYALKIKIECLEEVLKMKKE